MFLVLCDHGDIPDRKHHDFDLKHSAKDRLYFLVVWQRVGKVAHRIDQRVLKRLLVGNSRALFRLLEFDRCPQPFQQRIEDPQK